MPLPIKPPAEQQYRLLRVLEYVGTKKWIEESMLHRGVKGLRVSQGGIIKEAIVGEFSSAIEEIPNEN